MDLNNFLSEIETSVELENKYINCYTKFKNNYLQYKKSLKAIIFYMGASEQKIIIDSKLKELTKKFNSKNNLKNNLKNNSFFIENLLVLRNNFLYSLFQSISS